MKGTIAVLLLALCVASAQAQDKTTDIKGALEKNGHKLAAAVLDIAGVTKSVSNPKARYTFLLPTDAAITKFLKDMGLSVDDLKKRPELAKQLVAQHTLLGDNVREQEIFAKGNYRKVTTMASKEFKGDEDLKFKRADGKVTITDAQGNTVNVAGKPMHPDDNKTVIPIDGVLFGSEYYTDFAAVCKHRKGDVGRVTAFCDAVKTAGLENALKGLDATLFVPNDDAMAKATKDAKPSKEALANILKFHVVEGARELPKAWKNGASAKTLEGKDLTVTYKIVSGKDTKRKYDWAEASVNGVPVLKANVHVGKAVAHGIGAVLIPGAAAPKVNTEKAPVAKTGTRKLLQQGGSSGWAFSAGPTAVQDEVSSQIQAAVYGNESAADAALTSTRLAEELSVPGAYTQYSVGDNPW
jgi:uncharacterized surface protein with fasciclin (FAS1) repeats